jgi:ATP-dependent DNA helicase RecQ
VGQSVAWVKQQLQQLHSANIIDYIAQNNEPNVLILENRAPKLSFSEAKIEFLRTRYREKLAYINRYVLNTHQCRTKLLVEYFGEHLQEDCGYCEVCIKEKQTNKLKEQRIEHIKILLQKEALTVEQLLTQTDSEQSTEYLHILRWLKEQNWVAEDSNGLWHWQHKKS